MRRVYLKRFLKFIALMVPVILTVLLLQEQVFLYRDGNTERVRKFYKEEKNSLDVVVMGASEITAGYSPGYAYELYGFTSYMCAEDSNTCALAVPQLKQILAHQDPEVLLVEIYSFVRPLDTVYDEVKIRNFAENVPFSLDAWKTVLTFPFDEKISCLFPFIKYHGDFAIAGERLRYLRNYRDTIDSPSVTKGMMTNTVVYNGEGDTGVCDGTNHRIDDIRKTYLVEFMDHCTEAGLEKVVFVNYPRDIENESDSDLLSRVAHARQIVTEYGFDFIDLQEAKEQIGLDMCADFYNAHHLNPQGQQKVTAYLGNILMNQYGLTPREQSPENQAHWQDCVTFTRKYYEITQELTAAGRDCWFLMDDDLLPHLDPETEKLFHEARAR